MTTALVIWLAATVAALVVVIATGHAARRSEHYGSVVVFFVALLFAIREAGKVGRGFTYEGWVEVIFYVHFSFVGLVFLTVPFLIASGVQLARVEDPQRRHRHVKLASVFVVLVLITCVLGSLMTWGATPIEVAAGS